MMVALRVEVWTYTRGEGTGYIRRPEVEAQIAAYEVRWDAGRPTRGVFQSPERWKCVAADTSKVAGESVDPVIPVTRLDVYGDDTLVWRGWVTQERYTGGVYQYEAVGLRELAQSVWWATQLRRGISPNEVFARLIERIRQWIDDQKTPYEVVVESGVDDFSLDDIEQLDGGTIDSLFRRIEEASPRYFWLEGESSTGKWTVRFARPRKFPLVVVNGEVLEHVIQFHRSASHIQVVGDTGRSDAERYQMLKNGGFTGWERSGEPIECVLDRTLNNLTSSALWSRVNVDSATGEGYAGESYGLVTSASNFSLVSAYTSVEQIANAFFAEVAVRGGDTNSQALVTVWARDPVSGQRVALWLEPINLSSDQWSFVRSYPLFAPMTPNPHRELQIEISHYSGNTEGVRIGYVAMYSLNAKPKDWKFYTIAAAGELSWEDAQTNEYYVAPLLESGDPYPYGFPGGVELWIPSQFSAFFGQKFDRPSGSPATYYLVVWYERGVDNRDPEAWIHGAHVDTHYQGEVYDEFVWNDTGSVRVRIFRWLNKNFHGLGYPTEYVVGLQPPTNESLTRLKVYGMWFGQYPNLPTLASSAVAYEFFGAGMRSGFVRHTKLYTTSGWALRNEYEHGRRLIRVASPFAVYPRWSGSAWQLQGAAHCEPHRQLRYSSVLQQVEQIQPHRYFWRVGVEDYFVGSLTLSSDGRLEASLHEPEADLIRALRSVL